MKGRNIPQIINLQSSSQENDENESSHPQNLQKQSHYQLIPSNPGESKFNYCGLENSFNMQTNDNNFKYKKNQTKKQKPSQNSVKKSTKVDGTKNQHQKAIKSQKEHLEIYQFLRTNKLITGNKTLTNHRCKICNQFIDDEAINYCFQCEKCEKFCHFQCMVDTSICPRCSYNWKISKYKLPNQQTIINTKNKQEINKKQYQTYSDHNSNSNSNSDNIQNQRDEQNILQLTSVPEYYRTQVKSFMEKYPKYLDKNNNIMLPIQDNLIYQTEFIQYLLLNKQNKRIVLKQLPSDKELPHYYGQLIEIWNFYTNFKCMLGDKQISKYSLQTFSEQLKNRQIYTFILPVIDVVLNSSANSKVASILRLFQDLKSQNMFEYFGRYFWTYVILQLISNSKNKQDQICVKFNEKLNLMLDKRVHIVTIFEQKLQILKFVIEMAQKLTTFRNWVTDSIKDQAQKNTKITQIISMQRQKLKSRQKQATMRLSNIQEKMFRIKNSVGQKPFDYMQMKKLEQQKLQNLTIQEQLRIQTKKFREEIKSVEFANELQSSSKVCYLGKDRNKCFYWYVFGAEANAIFRSSFTCQKQISRQNVRGKISKWGFYDGKSLEQLFSSLNCAGIQQKRLKQNIQKLFLHHLITTTPTKKLSRAKSLYNQINRQIKQFRQEEQQQIIECKQFMSNNIRQINLSQLRKLLLESLKIFNNYIKKSVGVWGVNQEYQEKIKKEKFKSLEDIKKFVLEFGKSLYSLKNDLNTKSKGRQKRRSELWVSRLQIFSIWKTKLQSCTKNIQVFMFAFILYLQVVNTARKISHPEKYNKKGSYKKQLKSFQSRSRSKSNSKSSWSGSREYLMGGES